MRAWIFQDSRQKAKLGAAACPWSLAWYDPDTGKRRSKKIGRKRQAEAAQRKLEGEVAAGIYQPEQKMSWQEFRQKYEASILPNMRPGSQAVSYTHLSAANRNATFSPIGMVKRPCRRTRSN